MMDSVEWLYRQHLTDADRELLVRLVGGDMPFSVALADPRVERAVFGEAAPGAALLAVSPFLIFAVAVHRIATRLEVASLVEEPWAGRRRIPLFDVGSLRDLLADPGVRFFLVELLASYTHVARGSMWQPTSRGGRSDRLNELDPARLAGLLDVVEPQERAGVYRRLGDVALFLCGVFPDQAATVDLAGATAGGLRRLSGLSQAAADVVGRDLLELLGPRWYRLAALSLRAHGRPSATIAVVEQVSERFSDARRVLNAVTDYYLYLGRQQWFGTG